MFYARRVRRLSLLIALLVLAQLFGCGEPTPQPPPKLDPPRVFLTVPSTNVVDTEFTLTVSVDGCKSVKNVTVLDRGSQVASVNAPAVPLTVKLNKDQVSFKEGIYATLSLTATATCDDDRSNTSQPQPGNFFPVAKVIRSSSGQLVPDFFVVDGHTANPTFIGCSGDFDLVKVDTSGSIVKSLTLPFQCTYATSISERNAATGVRWIYTPGKGAIAFNQNLDIVAKALDATGKYIPVTQLGVADDGDAIVLAKGQAAWISRIFHDSCVTGTCMAPAWTTGVSLQAIPQGNPVITGTGVFLPLFTDDQANTATFFVQKLDYATGADGGSTILYQVTYPELDPAPQIAMTITPDGSKTLLPFSTSTGGTFQVNGCPTNASDCAGGWVAPGVSGAFQGAALAAAPFGAGFPYVAAIGLQNTYFIRTDTGVSVGKDGLPLTASGSLVTYAYQPGRAADFYVLNGDGASPMPMEIIGIDSPQNGELFRFQIPGGSLTIGLDDDGMGWMRVGNDLMQLLPLSEYRALRGP